jgi:hypothetical protein
MLPIREKGVGRCPVPVPAFGASWNIFDLMYGGYDCENGDCGYHSIVNDLAFSLNWDGYGSEQIHRNWGKQFWCNKTAQQVISALRNNFSSFANTINSTGPNAVFSPGSLSQGDTVLIDASYDTGRYALGKTNAVTVSSVTPTSFTLRSFQDSTLWRWQHGVFLCNAACARRAPGRSFLHYMRDVSLNSVAAAPFESFFQPMTVGADG